MYDSIAENYSSIFPLEPEKLDFISSYCKKENAKILDIGCATGDLAIELAKQGFSVLGIDLNRKMIDIARKRVEGTSIKADFEVLDMLDIGTARSYDCIFCLGNTLPHIQSWNGLGRFFELIHTVLNKDGYFIFQILNYDKILDDLKIEFKTIENDDFIFTRRYKKIEADEVEFEIGLYNKNEKKEYHDTTGLLPITKKRLVDCLEISGFGKPDCFSDYKRNSSSRDNFYNVYVVEST